MLNKDIEKLIQLNDPNSAYYYCVKLQKRIPELESLILKDSNCSYRYAYHIMKDRWLELEKKLLQEKNADFSCQYAMTILKRRWVEAEYYITKDIHSLYHYILNVYKRPWKEHEHIIKKSAVHWKYYTNWKKDNWKFKKIFSKSYKEYYKYIKK